MKVIITPGELMDREIWGFACDVLEMDPWCIAEGKMTSGEEITISEEQARHLGLVR
jgi:hypothetical protein